MAVAIDQSAAASDKSARPRRDVEAEGIATGETKPRDGGVMNVGPRRKSRVKGNHAGQAGANRRRTCSVGDAPEALVGRVSIVRDKLILETRVTGEDIAEEGGITTPTHV